MQAHLGFGHELIGLGVPLIVLQIFCCRELPEAILKKRRRLECGEGRGGGSFELEGLSFVLEIWQKSKWNWVRLQEYE